MDPHDHCNYVRGWSASTVGATGASRSASGCTESGLVSAMHSGHSHDAAWSRGGSSSPQTTHALGRDHTERRDRLIVERSSSHGRRCVGDPRPSTTRRSSAGSSSPSSIPALICPTAALPPLPTLATRSDLPDGQDDEFRLFGFPFDLRRLTARGALGDNAGLADPHMGVWDRRVAMTATDHRTIVGHTFPPR